MSQDPTYLPGHPAPLGATCQSHGVNFSVYSPDALGMDLLLFSDPSAVQPDRVFTLSAESCRTGDYWHILVPDCGHGQLYAWRARGPRNPAQGHLFDGDKVLLDPYGRAVSDRLYRRSAAGARGDNCACALRSVVIDLDRYDWEGDRPLGRHPGREFLYEMHLAGYTKSPSSKLSENRRGTFAGMIERIDHLRDLGVTAVELLPVFQFDSQDAPEGLSNVWGYSTQSFFSPHAAFSSRPDPAGAVDEFRDLVKALHRAEIRVILDVVFNHTAEAGPDGPYLSWRGLANRQYYIPSPDVPGKYADFTGCGNTFNANHPVVSRLIQDSLRYWVQHMHVDGFRFDLASALTRDQDGRPLDRPPVILAIESDPLLARTGLTAEAWDAGGLYQVGKFPGQKFAEWNGPFRDDVRRFWRGDENTIESLMARLTGSRDLFSLPDDRPFDSVNFVTCHDGFTLRDLVSYSAKHNLANGEDNRDGSDHNSSCHHGIEGETDDPAINRLRLRQIKNFLTVLFLSHGTPLLLMGDEVRHTRQGNNNPWCQDNAMNWLDWEAVEKEKEVLDFVRSLRRLTSSLDVLNVNRFWTATSPAKPGEITWHGTQLGKPDWSAGSRSLAYTLGRPGDRQILHVMLNASAKPLVFQLPANRPHWHWGQVIDTSANSPLDLILPGEERPVLAGSVKVGSRSVVVAEEMIAKS